MAPPSHKPKLANLTAEEVGLELATAVSEHAARYVMALLSPAYELHTQPRRGPDDLCRETQVYMTTRDLAAYAISGDPLDAPVQEYLVSLMLLWSSVQGDAVDVDGLVADADPETTLGLVICAAGAREAIREGEHVSAAQLAALAGLSATQVRLLARQGELEIRNGAIAAKNARRWLIARATPGFARGARTR